MSEHQQDKDLIEAFQQQESHAVHELFKMFYRPLVYYSTNLINDRQEAEDIVANTFMKLLHRRANFDNVRDIKAFLYVTTRNNCLDYLRSVIRHENSHRELFYLLENREDAADEEMLKAKILQEVYLQIEKLPEQCQKVFKLIFIQGLNTKQIAEQMGISAQTVLNQKAKAIQILRLDLLKKNLMPVPAFLHIWMLICWELFK